MLQPLPADTVFEAKKRAQSQTRILLGLLLAIYVATFNLISALIFLKEAAERSATAPPVSVPFEVYGWTTFAAMTLALLHFGWARNKSLESILSHLGARHANPADEAHNRFIHLTEEASVAIGRAGIRPVVISTSAMNAFAVETAGGASAIGVTEGMLARLNRSEMEAVVAHEASHLANGDSRVMATACSLFAVFDIFSSFRLSGRGKNGGAILFAGLIMLLGRFLSQLLYMAISRNREYYADSEAVHMCKNPSALAEALNKISSSDRGYLAVPEGFSAMFILNPALQAVDETEGFEADLLSTHPPVRSRISRLMKWANETTSNVSSGTAGPIFVHEEGAALLSPGAYSSFLCPRCTTTLVDETYEGIQAQRCPWCKGRLLPVGGITRAIVRRQASFSKAEMEDVRSWRMMQRGTLKDLCNLPHIECPKCRKPMLKRFHAEVTRVVIDTCLDPVCEAVWCDAGELEKIEMLIEVNDKPES